MRELTAAARWPSGRAEVPDVAHLALYPEGTIGPVQRDEALMLHGLIRVIRPRTVVEIGFLRGDSAFNFLLALDDESRLYSFDIDPACVGIAAERLGHDPRFTFRLRSQTEITVGRHRRPAGRLRIPRRLTRCGVESVHLRGAPSADGTGRDLRRPRHGSRAARALPGLASAARDDRPLGRRAPRASTWRARLRQLGPQFASGVLAGAPPLDTCSALRDHLDPAL